MDRTDAQRISFEDALWLWMESVVRVAAAAAAASVDASITTERVTRSFGLPVVLPAPVSGGEVQ